MADETEAPDEVEHLWRSPLAGAVLRGEPEVVTTLPVAREGPDTGTPTARDTARMFGQDEIFT